MRRLHRRCMRRHGDGQRQRLGMPFRETYDACSGRLRQENWPHRRNWTVRPVKNNRSKTLAKSLHSASVYENIVMHYARQIGLAEEVRGMVVFQKWIWKLLQL
jgi:hypothetical protein